MSSRGIYEKLSSESQRINRLRAEASVITAEREDLRIELDRCKAEIKDWKVACKSFVNEREEADPRCLQLKLSSHADTIEQYELTVQKLNLDILNLKKQYKNVQAEAKTIDREKRRLTGAQNQSEKHIQQLKEQVTQLEAQNQVLQTCLHQKADEEINKTRETEISDIDRENDQQKLQLYETEISRLHEVCPKASVLGVSFTISPRIFVLR